MWDGTLSLGSPFLSVYLSVYPCLTFLFPGMGILMPSPQGMVRVKWQSTQQSVPHIVNAEEMPMGSAIIVIMFII